MSRPPNNSTSLGELVTCAKKSARPVKNHPPRACKESAGIPALLCLCGENLGQAKRPRQPDTGPGSLGNRGADAVAAGRPHAELPRVVAAARRVAAGHHLPGRQARDGPRRGRPPQRPFPRLPGSDGHGPRRRPAGRRHHHPGLGVRQRPGRRRPARPARPARRLFPAPIQPHHGQHPDPRDGLGISLAPMGRGAGGERNSGSSTPGSPASARSTARPASLPGGGRRSSRRWSPSDRCHLNGLGMVDGKPKYVTALGETDSRPAGGRTRPAAAS